jgi:hypothetical protein
VVIVLNPHLYKFFLVKSISHFTFLLRIHQVLCIRTPRYSIHSCQDWKPFQFVLCLAEADILFPSIWHGKLLPEPNSAMLFTMYWCPSNAETHGSYSRPQSLTPFTTPYPPVQSVAWDLQWHKEDQNYLKSCRYLRYFSTIIFYSWRAFRKYSLTDPYRSNLRLLCLHPHITLIEVRWFGYMSAWSKWCCEEATREVQVSPAWVGG